MARGWYGHHGALAPSVRAARAHLPANVDLDRPDLGDDLVGALELRAMGAQLGRRVLLLDLRLAKRAQASGSLVLERAQRRADCLCLRAKPLRVRAQLGLRRVRFGRGRARRLRLQPGAARPLRRACERRLGTIELRFEHLERGAARRVELRLHGANLGIDLAQRRARRAERLARARRLGLELREPCHIVGRQVRRALVAVRRRALPLGVRRLRLG